MLYWPGVGLLVYHINAAHGRHPLDNQLIMALPSAHDNHADYTDTFSCYGKAIIHNYHASLNRRIQGSPPQLPRAFPDVISRKVAGSDLGSLTDDNGSNLLPSPRNNQSASVDRKSVV